MWDEEIKKRRITLFFHYPYTNLMRQVQQEKQSVWYAHSSSTLPKLLSITHLIFIWASETKCSERLQKFDYHLDSLFDLSRTFYWKITLPHTENQPVTAGPPRSCCLTLQPARCSSTTRKHHPLYSSQSFILNGLPSLFPVRSSSLSWNPPDSTWLWSALELTMYLPSYIHMFLLVNETAHSIRKGALLLHPSRLSNTLLLYSVILDKYLTWLKRQTWNEERAKRDFSIRTQSPVTSPPLLSRMYFWPPVA